MTSDVEDGGAVEVGELGQLMYQSARVKRLDIPVQARDARMCVRDAESLVRRDWLRLVFGVSQVRLQVGRHRVELSRLES